MNTTKVKKRPATAPIILLWSDLLHGEINRFPPPRASREASARRWAIWGASEGDYKAARQGQRSSRLPPRPVAEPDERTGVRWS